MRSTADGELTGARAIVLGLGRFGGGLGAVRWLRRQGAEVLVTDQADAATLGEAAASAEALGARLALGGHEGVAFDDADLLVVNPAVPLNAAPVLAARDAGVHLTTEIALLLEHWPGPVLGITGSNGKSTTVTLAHALLTAAGVPAERGGNLGGSLLASLDEPRPDGCVAVLELSSFMLEAMDAWCGPELGPDVGVLLNLTPNHLDRHGDMDAYAQAKRAILRRARVAVLNADDARVRREAAAFAGQVLWFGGAPRTDGQALQLGVTAGGDLVDEGGAVLIRSADVPLPGRMNRLDLAAALLGSEAIAGGCGVRQALAAGLAAYEAPPHRMQLVVTGLGAAWIDDSVATTPESTAASVDALGEPCVLVAGGHDKGLDPQPLLAAAAQHARVVLTVGEEGVDLARRLESGGVRAEVVGTVPAAVARATELLAQPGFARAVLLSPGYSSHDQYRDFTERGHDFARCAREATGASV